MAESVDASGLNPGGLKVRAGSNPAGTTTIYGHMAEW